MTFWIIVLAMLLIAALFVLRPMLRAVPVEQAEEVTATDIYRAELRELNDRIASTDGDSDVLEAERVELARRLLAAEDDLKNRQTASGATRSLRWASVASILAVPALVLPAYLSIGSPGLPDAPRLDPSSVNLAGQSVDQMVLIAERHLAKNPDDIRGWKVLAETYGRLNRPLGRARALRRVAELGEDTPFLKSELGEALTVAAGNIVTGPARRLFEKALAEEPTQPKANLYMALALEQDGRVGEALTRWKALQATRPEDQRFQQLAAASIARLEARVPSKRAGEIAALPQAERQSMIENMVEGLAERLNEEPNDFQGWVRLIRSYNVLGRDAEAQAAFGKAVTIFAEDQSNVGNLQNLAKSLGLKPAEKTDG
ncbi:c-type cytochrome biogenesis protein CcmI [Ahrensia sp. R2A130]|uniref:c-type cytochrome biogenesis protein CcmI n=1 Tax=Ahrensia sp. R2A130 TaxID=744979 RepID=UPI0001E0E8D0|nr:c-type cytochrome biogenesis protein CcmI [Ahrensia sp. R2A130]EFL88974.1 cytoChrome c-type biogenesis protein CycH [Ahrensia sp. R2A130]